MKKALLPLVSFFLIVACSKDDGKDAVDCFADALFVDGHHSASAENPHTINFNVTYSGTNTLDNTIKWDYGDGNVQTVAGVTTSHTYTQPGTYAVKASVSVNNASCTHQVRETVNINE